MTGKVMFKLCESACKVAILETVFMDRPTCNTRNMIRIVY